MSYGCDKAQITRDKAYEWRSKDKAFAKQWERALQAGVDALENEVMQRAKNGVHKGVWMKDHNGRIKKVETLTEYPETVAMFLLKAHKSKVYREPKTEFGMTQTAPDGTVTEFAVHVSKDELP